MSLLIFSLRRQQIIALKSSIDFKLLNLNQKLMDLQSYAAAIADGPVTVNDFMTVPPSLFGRMTMYSNYSNQMAAAGAAEKTNMLLMMNPGIMNQAQPGQQEQVKQMIYRNIMEQEFKTAAEAEKKILNIQDKRIQQEVAQLQSQLKMLDAEQETVSKAEDDAAKKAAPQYVA